METAHAAARDDKCLVGMAAHIWDEFVHNIVEPLFMECYATVMVALHVAPRLAVDAVNTDEPDESAVDEAGEHTHHVEVLIVVKTSVLRREDQHGMSLGAVGLVFHVTPKGVAVFLHVIDIHCLACT